MLKILITPLRWAIRLVLALVIVFEEWGWEPLKRWVGKLSRLPAVARLETRLRGLPPYGALAVLLLPSLLILPVKLLALWLLTLGRVGLGMLVVIAAKLVGTAMLAWLFGLIQPSLMRLAWFARLYGRWSNWKAELLAWVRASLVWRWSRVIKRAALRWLRRWRTAQPSA